MADGWTIAVSGTAAAGQDYTVTIGLNALTYAAVAGDTNATIASNLQALLAASTWGEFAANTFVVSATVATDVLLTGPKSGEPIAVTAAATGTGSLTATRTTTPSSPNSVKLAVNWDTGVLPTTGDDVFFDHGSYDALWDLDTFAGVVFNSLTITQNFESGDTGNGTLGLPEVNETGANKFVEYRPTAFQCAPTTCTIGEGSGSGSGRLKLDFGSAQVALAVHATGSALDPDLETLLVTGSHVANAAVLTGGSVALAGLGGQASTFATVQVADGAAGSPLVRLGAGCATTTLTMDGGTVTAESAPATINKTGGTLTILAGNITTANLRSGAGGTTAYQGSGTLTTLSSTEPVDFTEANHPTVTNATFSAGGYPLDPLRQVTWTNGVILSQMGLADVPSMNLGKNVKLVITNL